MDNRDKCPAVAACGEVCFWSDCAHCKMGTSSVNRICNENIETYDCNCTTDSEGNETCDTCTSCQTCQRHAPPVTNMPVLDHHAKYWPSPAGVDNHDPRPPSGWNPGYELPTSVGVSGPCTLVGTNVRLGTYYYDLPDCEIWHHHMVSGGRDTYLTSSFPDPEELQFGSSDLPQYQCRDELETGFVVIPTATPQPGGVGGTPTITFTGTYILGSELQEQEVSSVVGGIVADNIFDVPVSTSLNFAAEPGSPALNYVIPGATFPQMEFLLSGYASKAVMYRYWIPNGFLPSAIEVPFVPLNHSHGTGVVTLEPPVAGAR